MLKAKDALIQTLKSVALIQICLTVTGAGIALLVRDPAFALALLYGGVCTLLGTLVHAWSLKRATEREDGQPTLNVGLFFQGVLLKWGIMAGLLLLGMKVLQLAPAAILIGFALAYIGFMFSRGYAARSRG